MAARLHPSFRFIIIASCVAVFFDHASSYSSESNRPKAEEFYKEANGLFDTGDFKKAADTYRAAIAEDPEFVEAYHNYALASEMVDRKQALEAWERFHSVAADKEKFKFDAARIRARLQILKSMPDLPDTLRPDRYVPGAGDYYSQISAESEGEEWKRFPVKVFFASPLDREWNGGAKAAIKDWSSIIPLELVDSARGADIVLGWEDSDFEEARVTWGGGITPGIMPETPPPSVTPGKSYSWPKGVIRVFVAHQLGHKLGIKGHSSDPQDIMFKEPRVVTHTITDSGDGSRSRDKSRNKGRGGGGSNSMGPMTLVLSHKRLTPRDLNTLIRLYNHAGLSMRFK